MAGEWVSTKTATSRTKLVELKYTEPHTILCSTNRAVHSVARLHFCAPLPTMVSHMRLSMHVKDLFRLPFMRFETCCVCSAAVMLLLELRS